MSDENQVAVPHYGVDQTKELLVGVNELSIVLIKHLKDGVQLADAPAILDDLKNNPEVLAKLLAAKDRISEVPAEIKDVDFMEGVQLAMVQAAYVPKILEAAKKV